MKIKITLLASASLLLTISLFCSTQAFAHAHLINSEPAKDSIIHTVPTSVTLHFNEELEASMSKLEVMNLETGNLVTEGRPTPLNEDKSTLHIMVNDTAAPKKKTRYEVSWKAVSKDSHKMTGKFEFSFQPATKRP
ncbi:MAG: copper resistance protein CopC [Cryobacterium sp.]|nr:copper resistance protein CopC [Oligoflexia bacterium]